MFGISWGGFNSIQMALRHPPALKAIIAVDATEDLYQEDVHFIDGILHVDSWEMSQDLDNARPGAPDYVIDDAYFRDRFDTQPWMMTYKRQQRDGPFWDRASAKGRYDDIRIPAFFIGGWYDGYRDSVPRMLEHLKGPVKAIMGAWNHTFPNEPYPKPGIEWRREAVRWFDQWLKGIDTGIMKEPQVRGLRAPVAQARALPRGGARLMALGGGLADRAHSRPRAVCAAESHAGRRGAGERRARAALLPLHRHRGRRPGDVVGRCRPRSAADGCLQPGLRLRSADRGHRDPRDAAGEC